MRTIIYTNEGVQDIRALPPVDRRNVVLAVERVASGEIPDEMMNFGKYKRFRVGFVLVRYVENEEMIRIEEARVTFTGK